MKKIIFFAVLFVFVNLEVKSQEIAGVIHVKSDKNKTITISGNLSDGVIIDDLSWAWSSSVACFPETQKQKFTGNHVLFSTSLPPYSEMEITVIPKNKNDDFSIYAYQIGANSSYIVPNLSSCVSCEAEHKWDRPKKNRVQNHTRTVSHLTAIRNPYKVIIGIVGANGLTKGKFTLEIKLKSR